MTEITTRSKIAIRYTTNPANMGYDGVATDWQNARPYKVTSPSKALDYLANLRREMGGTYYAVHLSCGGVEVSRDDLSEVVQHAEGVREMRRMKLAGRW